MEMLLAELVVMIGRRHLSASLYLVLQCIVEVLLEFYSVRVDGDSCPPNRRRQLRFEASSELGLVAALLLCLNNVNATSLPRALGISKDGRRDRHTRKSTSQDI